MGQPTLSLCGSVIGEGSEKGLYRCLASGDLPSTHPVSSHFAHFLYATGTLPAVALGLNPRVAGCAYILRLCGSFKWSFLKIQQFLLMLQPPLVFTARSYGDLSSQCWNPGLCSVACHWDHSLPRHPHPHFYPPHMTVALLVPILDEYGFFKSLLVRLPYSSIV